MNSKKLKIYFMVIYVKNMVCVRCKMLIKKILDDMGLAYNKVEIGEIDLKYPLTKYQRESLNIRLNNWDLSLIESNNEILVEKIKARIINMIHNDSSISPVKKYTADLYHNGIHHKYPKRCGYHSRVSRKAHAFRSPVRIVSLITAYKTDNEPEKYGFDKSG